MHSRFKKADPNSNESYYQIISIMFNECKMKNKNYFEEE